MSTTETPSPAAAPPEATVRALVTGSAIGLLLAAGNVYTGLKTGFIDGGGITAALLAFALFSRVKPSAGRRPFGLLENNITQTTAASAAVMGFVLGLGGTIPGLGMMGVTLSGWVIVIWGLAAGFLGIVAAVVLRQKLIVDDALPFPTGGATAEVIETIYTARAAAVRRALVLAGAAAVAAAVTWFRDGHPRFIPQTTAFGFTMAGVAAATLTLGMYWSPLLVSVGGMIGPRAASSVLIGGGISWVVLAPRLLKAGIVQEASFGAFTSWLVWPALGLLLAGSFAPLLLDAGSLRRSFGDLAALARGRAAGSLGARPDARPAASKLLISLVLASVLTLVVVGRIAFGVSPAVSLLAVLLSFALMNLSARATGETDVGPVGAMGLLTLGVFARTGTVGGMMIGSVATGSASQTCQALWAFRAGHRLGASPRAQVAAQFLGAVVGAAVVVPVYFLVVKAYGVGTEALPAAPAQSWRAVAEAARATIPPYGLLAGGLGLAVGFVLALCERTRVGRFLPSPAAMGTAMLIPGSYALAIFTGAILVVIARRLRPDLNDAAILTVAAGGMAGESLTGVLAAALTSAGVL